jgi:tetratricopeptide (TPR) repeat protein
VQAALYQDPLPAAGLVRVVAFAREAEFHTFAPERTIGIFALVRGEAILLLPGGLGEGERAVLAHELAHHLLTRRFARQPPWFSEGTACFAESVAASGPDAAGATAGGVPLDRLRQARAYRGSAAPVVLARRPLEPHEYGAAWALVHFLTNAHERRFRELQDRLERGGEPGAAFREIFPEWNPGSPDGAAALDRELEQYLRRGTFTYARLRLDRDRPEPVERPLSPPEVHTIRLLLPRAKDDAIAVGAEAVEALAEDRGHVVALERRAASRPDEARTLAERATAAHPEDVWAWMLLKTATEGAEREAALRKAVAVAPDQHVAVNSLAWFLVEAGRAEEALPLAQRAAALAAWNGYVLDTLAAALAAVGRCDDALSAPRRATESLPDQAPRRARADLVGRLAELERRCGGR